MYDQSADDATSSPSAESGGPHGDPEILHIGKILPQKLLQICTIEEIVRLRRSEGVVEKGVGLLCREMKRSLGARDAVSAFSWDEMPGRIGSCLILWMAALFYPGTHRHRAAKGKLMHIAII